MPAQSTQTASNRTNHKWRFFRAGGFDQVRLDAGADLASLAQLDQKLWVALACPTTGLHFDARTLQLIDTDKDGRVRASELLAAVQWTVGLLKNPNDLTKGSATLALNAINDATDEGQAVLASARRILETLKKADGSAITVEDTTQVAEKFVETVLNGDGIIIPETAKDDATKAVIDEIIACLGADTDRSGKPGIGQAKVDQFFADCAAYSDWWKKAEGDKTVFSLGDVTAVAAAAVQAVKAKVDDYFARCRLAAFDPRAVNALNREEKEYLALAAKDLTITHAEIAGFPLARVEAGKPLPLGEGVNPAWADAVAKLRHEAVKPCLGDKAALTEAEWGQLLAKLAPYECWLGGKAGASVEKLGRDRVRQILAGKTKDTLTQLIAEDKKLEPQFTAIASVEKLVRFHRDLHLLCTNFVNFKDFYDRGEPAIFQAGTLYLDQRSCELCLPVEDAAKHGTMSALAGTYLAYCDCARKGSGEKRQIVAAFTDGDSDNLMVGRNGIFYDRQGRDWDATITKIIDNPISLRQAFWAPYKKFVRMIEEQVAKRAAAADAAATAKLQTAATATATADKAKPAEPKKLDIGSVAAIGIAFGAIGSFLATAALYTTGIIKAGPLAIVGALIGLLLLISGPSMLIAWLKLRKRNLGPILDANGWAVNAKAKLTVPFGKALTQVATLPPGSERDLTDPYAEKKSPWPTLIVLALILWAAYAVLNKMGYIHEWTQGRLGSPKAVTVEQAGTQPAATRATAATNAPAK